MLVHGLWLSEHWMALLGRRLRQGAIPVSPVAPISVPAQARSEGPAPDGPVSHAGRLRTVGFNYAAVSQPAERTLERLAMLVRGLEAPAVHFVCHSLGGLVVRHLLVREPELPPGRIVTLGTPHTGSCVARRLARWRFGRAWLGYSLGFGLAAGEADLPALPAGREVGSLGGTLPWGLGRLVAPIPRPHDGTVALAETRVPGLADHMGLRVSHLGMLASAGVATQVAAFLARGRFAH